MASDEIIRQLNSELDSLHKAIAVINHLAAELDIDVAMNSVRTVALELLDCEKVTLFLVFDRRRELRGKVPRGEAAEGLVIKVKYGEGIAGTVACTGETMNIPDAYMHPLFNLNIDKMTGFRTRNIICCPICDLSGHRVAVLQALNKNNGQNFSATDEKHLKLFGVHLGNSLAKARLHEQAKREKERLAAIYTFFKAMSSAEDVAALVNTICEALREVLQAEHVFVFLSDSPRGELWAQWQVMGSNSMLCVRLKFGQGIVGQAAATRMPISLPDGVPLTDPVFRILEPVLGHDARNVKSALVQPVVDSNKCLAVILAINKVENWHETDMFYEDYFTHSDSDAMKLFALEVGDALAERSLELALIAALSVVSPNGVRTTRLNVTTRRSHTGEGADLLRSQLMSLYFQQAPEFKKEHTSTSCTPTPPNAVFHRTSSAAMPIIRFPTVRPETCSLREGALSPEVTASSRPPSLDLKSGSNSLPPRSSSDGIFHSSELLLNWELDFTKATVDDLVKMAYDMFLISGIIDHFALNAKTLRSFLTAVSSHYKEVPYHNFNHVVHVLHAVWMVIMTTPLKEMLSMVDQLALLVAAVCHDLDHDGHSNSWHVNTCSELARIYNDISVLENHHCAMTFAILDKKDCALFEGLDAPVIKELRKSIIAAIMSTDMVSHFTLTQTFKQHPLHYDANCEADRVLLMKVLLHAADIGNAVRTFPVNQVFSGRVHAEFQAQAADEVARFIPVTFNVNTDDKVMCARVELNFLDYVVAPLWEQLVEVLPSLESCLTRLNENRTRYSSMLEELEGPNSPCPSHRSSTNSISFNVKSPRKEDEDLGDEVDKASDKASDL